MWVMDRVRSRSVVEAQRVRAKGSSLMGQPDVNCTKEDSVACGGLDGHDGCFGAAIRCHQPSLMICLNPLCVALIHSDLDESKGFHSGIEERVRETYQGCANIPPKQSRLPHNPHSIFTCRFFCVRFLKHHVPEVPERGKRDDLIGFH